MITEILRPTTHPERGRRNDSEALPPVDLVVGAEMPRPETVCTHLLTNLGDCGPDPREHDTADLVGDGSSAGTDEQDDKGKEQVHSD